ncbi:MAG: hypothetical protein MI975_09250 [Cytophagales bacterium]|nr:hypothetical protein [Cytophagales bacterium]
MNEDKLKSKKIKWIVGVLLFFTLYATVRYIIFKGVDPVHFPMYITNKILSTSGLFFIALSYSWGKLKGLKPNDKNLENQFVKFLGLAGFSCSAMHVFISMIILSPEYYQKLYEGNMMNLKGELSMLMGVFSIYCFSIPAITTIPFMQEAVGINKWQRGQRIGYLGLFTALLHVLIMGVSGWLRVADWPGYLPPITLIATIIAVFPLYLKFVKR